MLHGSVCTYDGSSVPPFLIVSGWGLICLYAVPRRTRVCTALAVNYTLVAFRIKGDGKDVMGGEGEVRIMFDSGA